MKPCPQCGAPLHLAANRWIHASSAHCLLIVLLATPEEISQHGTSPTVSGARFRPGAVAPERESKFRYLAPGAEGAD